MRESKSTDFATHAFVGSNGRIARAVLGKV